MLPAQIPLTLEHLFPTPSNSNRRTAIRAVLVFPGTSHDPYGSILSDPITA